MVVVIFVSFFIFGYIETYKIVDDEALYYLFLTMVSMLSTVVITSVLRKNYKYKIHLWVLFILIMIGYYVKIYILGYLVLHLDSYYDYLNAYFPLQTELLVNNPSIFITYYEVVTAMLSSFALIVVLLSLLKLNAIRVQKNLLNNRILPKYKINKNLVKFLLISAQISILFILYVMIHYSLGLVSPGEREATLISYKLPTIIQTFARYFIPMLLFISLWLSITARFKFLVRVSIFLFLFWGVSIGLVSTSKEPLIIAMASIFLTFFLCNAFGKKQIAWFIVFIPILFIFSDFLSLNRVTRHYYYDEGIVDIAIMLLNGTIQPSSFLTLKDLTISPLSTYLGIIMRIGGADSLLSILDYNMTELRVLLHSSESIVDIFTRDVLGVTLVPGLRFSPSLLGSFILALGGVFKALIAFVLYVIFWNKIFTLNFKSRLMIKPFLTLLLLLVMARTTSEGSFSGLSVQFLLIVIFGIVGEIILKRLYKPVKVISSTNRM